MFKEVVKSHYAVHTPPASINTDCGLIRTGFDSLHKEKDILIELSR